MKNARLEQRRWADEAFEKFWASFPRKVAKLAAKRKWDALRPTPELVAKIAAALEWQVPLWTDPQFIPYPSTWLNQGRWDDERPRSMVAPSNGKSYSHTPSDCRHKQPCLNVWEHAEKIAKGES